VAPSGVRNAVLVGSDETTTTALVQSLLAAAGGGAQNRSSGSASVCSFEHAGLTVNLLVAPAGDQVGDGFGAMLTGAEAAVFILSAAQTVEARSLHVWDECADAGMARALVITGLDGDDADFEDAVEACQDEFGESALPLSLPLHDEVGTLAGLIGLLSQRIADHSGGDRVEREADPEHLPLIHEHSRGLVEGILAESEDDTLLDRYLDGEIVTPQLLHDGLASAVARGVLFPVTPIAPLSGVGMVELLDLITGAFPSPLQQPLPVATGRDGSPRDALTCDPAGPLAAVVLTADHPSYDGAVVVRVLSGTLRIGLDVGLASTIAPGGDGYAAIGALVSSRDALPLTECAAGDICVVSGLPPAQPGDSVYGLDSPLRIATWRSAHDVQTGSG